METDFLRWLRQQLPPHPLLKLGIGDDAAVLATAGRNDVVVTTDLIADGVDFDLKIHSPEQIGHKALAINLSDLAAMAAQPLAAVIALNLPRQNGSELAQKLYEGMLPLAERFHIALAGGDTNSWDGRLVISVTVLGETTLDGPLCRSGATAGDRIIVTGVFGGSILGRHLDVAPRVEEALLLHQRYPLRAGIDCSDGLSLDLWHVCEESRCGAIIDLDKIPIATAAHELSKQREDGVSAIEHALSDGEDFELILAVPPAAAEQMLVDQPLDGVRLTDVGEFIAARRLLSRNSAGQITPLAPHGFQHVFS
ncbi:MAG TPA: thiamine-phosphate kinase [Pirellulales bacterium]|jgi:thiamine-monophosphate kinase|nr:thiamine-phosphate kinase [Pirellulales bacterium]